MYIHVIFTLKSNLKINFNLSIINDCISDFLEHYVSPESNTTLRALLTNPIKFQIKRKVGRSFRKFHKLSGQIIRPGYSSESQFACRHCGKRYRWKSTMKRHEQVECGGKEPGFQCPKCPYRAKQKGNLNVHVRKYHYSQYYNQVKI